MSRSARFLLALGFLFSFLALALILCWAVYLNQLLPELVANQAKIEHYGGDVVQMRRESSDSHRLLIDMAEQMDFSRGDNRQLMEMVQNAQVALHKLQKQCADCCQSCKCCPCSPCKCSPCRCKDKPVPPTAQGCAVEACKPTAKFCRFTMVQIWDDRVWFKWLDTESGQHESRMSLEEFKRFDTGEDK